MLKQKEEYERFFGFELSESKWEEIKQLKLEENKKNNKDLSFKIFNHLIVFAKGPSYISPKGHRQSQWWCICDCPEHNIILVRGNNLTSNNTKSCGCQNTISRKNNMAKIAQSRAIDLTNQYFGELKALQPTHQRKNKSVVWECLCSCGKKHYITESDLKSHKIESCGCSKESKGIKVIKTILENNNIVYETEKTFSTCRFLDTNACARFDFYINNNFLLEFDGIQHFKEGDVNFFKDSLEKRKEHDNYKNQWCKQNGIALKRIPYYDLDFLSLELIMGDKYLV